MNRRNRSSGLAIATGLLTVLLFAPSALSAQLNNTFVAGVSAGTWAAEDYLNIKNGIAVDAGFLFGVGDTYRLGPVIEYGNFAAWSDGDRVEKLDLGVEGRFIDMSRKWSVDPFIALRLAYATQSTDTDGHDLSTSGVSGQAAAGFYYPWGNRGPQGEVSVGVRALTVGDYEDAGTTVANSGGTSFYWFVKVGIAVGSGS